MCGFSVHKFDKDRMTFSALHVNLRSTLENLNLCEKGEHNKTKCDNLCEPGSSRSPQQHPRVQALDLFPYRDNKAHLMGSAHGGRQAGTTRASHRTLGEIQHTEDDSQHRPEIATHIALCTSPGHKFNSY